MQGPQVDKMTKAMQISVRFVIEKKIKCTVLSYWSSCAVFDDVLLRRVLLRRVLL